MDKGNYTIILDKENKIVRVVLSEFWIKNWGKRLLLTQEKQLL